MWLISLSLSATGLLISFYPFVSALQAAQSQNVKLSWREYLSGFYQSGSTFNFTTQTFAVVDGNELRVDIYSPPADVRKKEAALIVVHGGSWNAGERNDFPEWNRWLVKNGYTVFDIDYRLTQPNWQTATGDVKCAINWVQQNAEQFNISPQKIALLGRSAGGHLALLAAYSENNPELPASCGNAGQSKIRAVVSFYAPTELIWDYENPANQKVINGPLTLRNLMGGQPSDSAEMRSNYLLASPTTHISPNSAPTLLIHGGQDQLVLPQNMNFVSEKLRENNVSNEEIYISYAQHGFDYNFKGWGAQIARAKILQFLEANLKDYE